MQSGNPTPLWHREAESMALRTEAHGRLVQMMTRDAGQLLLMGNVGVVPELLRPFGHLAQVAVALCDLRS